MTADHHLRVASYNVHKAVGTDRRRDPMRVLGVVAALRADIVALQEADLRLPPRRSVFDTGELRQHTRLHEVDFDPEAPAIGWHGNAVLVSSRVTAGTPTLIDLPGLEPRGAAIVPLDTPVGRVRFVATHLGLRRTDRHRQCEALVKALAEDDTPVILAGDLNERLPMGGLAPLARPLRIVRPGASFHARRPFAAFDRFAVDRRLRVDRCGVHHGGQAHRASDHLPVWCDLRLA